MITIDAHAHLGDSAVSKLSVTPGVIAQFIKEIGSQRMMMGADELLNMPVELKKFEIFELPEQDTAWYLGQTAINFNQASDRAEQMPHLMPPVRLCRLTEEHA